MKIINLFILFLILYFLPIYAQVTPTVINSDTSKITFTYGLTDEYYTSWKYTKINKSSGSMEFKCDPPSATSRTCSYSFISDLSFYFFSNLTGCTNNTIGTLKCDIEIPEGHYPKPIISTTNDIPLEGTEKIVTGSFIKFVKTSNQNTTLYNSKTISVIDSGSDSFNPTNAILRFPAGCGSVNTTFSQDSMYIFNYVAPQINVNDPGTGILTNGNTYQLMGKFFCTSVQLTVTLDNTSIPQSDIIVDSANKLNFTVRNMPTYASNVVIVVSHINGGVKSNSVTLAAPPHLDTVTSAPLEGGPITITGERLYSNVSLNREEKISIYINFIPCNVNMSSSSNTLVVCVLQSGTSFGDFPIVYNVDSFKNTDLIFQYGLPVINQISVIEHSLTLHGTCLASINATSLISINNATGNINETTAITKNLDGTLTFELFGRINGNVSIILKNTYKLANGTSMDRIYTYYYNLPLSYTLLSQGSFLGAPFIFLLYFIDKNNIDVMPNLSSDSTLQMGFAPGDTIRDMDNHTIGGTAFSFRFASFCDSTTGTIIIGTNPPQTLHDVPLASLAPAFKNDRCDLNGTIAQCTGINVNDDLVISYSGYQITPLEFNLTNGYFSFEVSDNFYSSKLTINSCNQSASVTLVLDPVFTYAISNQLGVNGGFITIHGKHFTSATQFVMNCGRPDAPITNPIYNATYFTVQVQYAGYSDISCNYTLGATGKGSIILSYHVPTIITTNSLYPKYGGDLIIYGDNFYNDPNMSISLDNTKCLNPKYISSTIVWCQLPALTNLGDSNTLYNSKNVTVTIFGKTGSSPVFKYTIYSDGLTTDYSGEYSHLVYLIVPIIIGFASVYLAFGYLLYRKSLNRN